jgi:hypothetical protein
LDDGCGDPYSRLRDSASGGTSQELMPMTLMTRAIAATVLLTAGGVALAARPAASPVTPAAAAAGFTTGNPGLASAGALAFGPGNVLFVGDSRGGAVYALDIADPAPDAHKGAVAIEHIDRRIAEALRTTADDILIHDMAVHPATRQVYFSVTRGRGSDGRAAIVRAGLDGRVAELPLDAMRFARLSLRDVPAAEAKTPWGASARAMAITDLGFVEGELLIAGLSNEAFASTLRRAPYPFTAGSRSIPLEIFHTSHNRYETASPIETFLTTTVKGKPALLAGYGCAPLAVFEMSALQPGGKVRGTTIAELGGGNRPHDIIEIVQNGQRHLIVANSDRTLMRIAAADLDTSEPLTRSSTMIYESFGTPYVAIAEVGVLQLDKLDAEFILLVQRDVNDGSLDLRTHPVKFL